MYSVLLAAMLSTTPATPQWGHGCHGCWGGCSGCWGCWGGCYGCWGCSGGWGYGWPAYSGWGYGYSGWGCGGAFGCAGGGYACIGCYGYYGWGTYHAAAPVVAPPKTTGASRSTSYTGLPATVVVQAPDHAKVFVEGKQIKLKADGSFTTPRLQAGETYVYEIRADAVGNGRVVSESKKVRVWAGRTSRVAFPELQPTAVAAGGNDAVPATARITVRVPKDAKLYVNGELCPLQSVSRSFDTPKLDPGREYTYTIKAEVVRDGRTRAEKKTVAFRAGQPVTVDFRDLDAIQTVGR